MNVGSVTVELLARHRHAIPALRDAYVAEWPDWYGAGGRGDAERDLHACAAEDRLPIGWIALLDGEVCGIAVLKAESIASRRHLSPWAAGAWVRPALRGRGIGSRLFAALEAQARALGFERIYCATRSAESLLRRRGWRLVERVLEEGDDLGVYAMVIGDR